jgi:NTE family protein
MRDLIDTLVISGGGIKGIVFIGVFKYLEELDNVKIDIKRIYAVSVGSIISLLYAIGYTSKEMEDEIFRMDTKSLQSIRLKTFIKNYGLDSGKKIMKWLEELIEKKGYNKTLTFKQLLKLRGVDLNIGSTNLNKYKDVYFNNDTSPNLRIIRAIRMSIGIPLVFSSVKYKGEIYVDGGVINSYPIKNIKNLDNVLGLKILLNNELQDLIDEKIENIGDYLYHVFYCYMLQKEMSTTLSMEYSDYTVFINPGKFVHSIKFDLNREDKKNLIECGYQETKRYFEKDNNKS